MLRIPLRTHKFLFFAARDFSTESRRGFGFFSPLSSIPRDGAKSGARAKSRSWGEESSLVKGPRENDRVVCQTNLPRSCPVVKRNFNPSCLREGVTFPPSQSYPSLSSHLLVGLSSRWMEIFIYLSRHSRRIYRNSRWILHASSRFPLWYYYQTAVFSLSADLGIEISTLRSQKKRQTDVVLGSSASDINARPTTPFSVRFARSAKFKAVGPSRA